MNSEELKELQTKIQTYYNKLLLESHTVIDNQFSYQFHYASRLFLINDDTLSSGFLDNVAKLTYLGSDPIIKLQNKFLTISKASSLVDKMSTANNVLFFLLFSKTIYKTDLYLELENFGASNIFKEIYLELTQDLGNIYKYKTVSANFITLFRYYLNSIKVDYSMITFDQIYDLAKIIFTSKTKITKNEIKKIIYLFTHCIIGDTLFYSKEIDIGNLKVFSEMMQFIDEIMFEHLYKISLDCKFEYLLCCLLIGFEPKSKSLIMQEAKISLCEAGDYLVGKYNICRTAKGKIDSPLRSEHRNVLFLGLK